MDDWPFSHDQRDDGPPLNSRGELSVVDTLSERMVLLSVVLNSVKLLRAFFCRHGIGLDLTLLSSLLVHGLVVEYIGREQVSKCKSDCRCSHSTVGWWCWWRWRRCDGLWPFLMGCCTLAYVLPSDSPLWGWWIREIEWSVGRKESPRFVCIIIWLRRRRGPNRKCINWPRKARQETIQDGFIIPTQRNATQRTINGLTLSSAAGFVCALLESYRSAEGWYSVSRVRLDMGVNFQLGERYLLERDQWSAYHDWLVDVEIYDSF